MNEASKLKELIKKIIENYPKDDLLAHRQYANILYGNANDDNVAKMSWIKHYFDRYIISEEKNGRRSAKYKWNIEEIKKDHFSQEDGLSAIPEMKVALRDELTAARKDVQKNSYEIKNIEGIRLGYDNEIYKCVIKIDKDEQPKFKDGCPADIRRDGQIISSAILIEYDAPRSTAYLKSNKDLSQINLTKKTSLIVDLTWLLEKMIEKLNKIDLEEDLIYNNLPIREFTTQSLEVKPIRSLINPYPTGLTQSQAKAYQKSIGQNFNLIWGPPGTGKSYTLGRVLFSLSSLNQKTLVCCISNVAVDSLMKAFSKNVREYESNNYSVYLKDKIVRLGITRDKEILEDDLFEIEDEYLIELKNKVIDLEGKLKYKNIGQSERLQLRTELEDYYREIKAKTLAKLNQARIVFMTAAQFNAFNDFDEIAFDNIVIDEASMMYPPQFVALCSGITQRIILAGDFRQLGPVYLSRTRIAIKWLKKDIFTYGKIFDRYRNVEDREYLSKLVEQFRSHENICKLINKTFYAGELKVKYKCPEIELHQPINKRIVTYYDLGEYPEFKVRRTRRGSRYNDFSADISIKTAVKVALNQNIESVAIITPYRAQVSKLKRLLSGISEECKSKVKIGTVHSFQGSEADVVIIDLVDSPDTKISLLYQYQTGERLINVAVSRAKHKLIVVGDIKAFYEGSGHTLVSHLSLQVLKKIEQQRVTGFT